MTTYGNLADTERTEAAMDTYYTRLRSPAQQCPYCEAVISVKPASKSEAAQHAAMDSMVAKFETHLKQRHGIGSGATKKVRR
jgi:hypothetical protein